VYAAPQRAYALTVNGAQLEDSAQQAFGDVVGDKLLSISSEASSALSGGSVLMPKLSAAQFANLESSLFVARVGA
jgi:hypothetical protein